MKKASIITYGCQMNVNESAKMKQMLQTMGYSMTEDIENTDLVFLNTCTVREGAATQIFGKLGELKALKEKRGTIIGVTGCFAQEQGEELVKKFPIIDIVMGNQNIGRIPQAIEKIENNESTHEVYTDNEDELPPRLDGEFGSDQTASISITYGCNNFCTFCIVPYVRGRERSVPLEEIVKDVEQYVSKGAKEIVLLGQNVNSYGKTLRPKVTFPELLKMVNEIDGIERIRFLTSHPKDCSDELIDAMASLDKVCENIHLPFQSGSNKILKDMHRVYTREHYLELIRKLKEKVPNITLSTDIIVGFPGETEEDFEDTLSMVEKVGYDQGFTFLYSIRKGTKAAEMQNQIPHEVKQERFQRLIDSMYKIFYEKNKECLGQTLEVLVEGISKNNPDILTGRTRGYKLVHFKGGKRNIGQLVNVKITGHNSFALEGEIV